MGLVGGVVGFCLGLPIGLAAAYFVYLRYFAAARRLQDPVIKPLRDLDSETLQATIPHIPLWVKSPDYERIDWMNKFIFDMWPFLDKAICKHINRATRPIFDQYVGQYGIESIEFGELTLGTLPPTFQGIKVYEMLEKELVIEPVIRWASTSNVTVNVKVQSFEVTVQLEDLHIMLTPRVILKSLVPSFPCFANLCVSLMEKDQLSKQISNLYHWPKVIQIPILDGASGATKKPVGILHVKVIRALNLLKMDFLGKSDPYVKMRLSGERLPSKKTSVKMSNLNPEWNEHFRFIVKDPDTQVLELHMFDWEKVKMHDKLGMQVIPLRLLTPYESKLFTLDLVRSMNPNDPQNKKNRGKLIVELTFDPLREDNMSSDAEGNASVRRDADGGGGGVLLVSVENAEDVEGKRHTNPYAEVLFRGERKKTKVIRKTREPRWSEEFQFMESLGHVNINLVDVVNNGRINEKYHLINSRNGMIHVEIKWSTV
ncbi:Synaptotagmin-3 [Zea mays]|uniref:Synaptotagmin-3 n=1 Tax=Zea mays TaxID=4577 RepID=A0A3L6EUX1_MAIZE|nr:Synaptotagmin-3 [Zea mays]